MEGFRAVSDVQKRFLSPSCIPGTLLRKLSKVSCSVMARESFTVEATASQGPNWQRSRGGSEVEQSGGRSIRVG